MPAKTLYFQSPRALTELYCGEEKNLAKVETALGVTIVTRDDWVQIDGEEPAVAMAEGFFDALGKGRQQGLTIRPLDFDKLLEGVADGRGEEIQSLFDESIVIQLRRKSIVPKTVNQKRYLQAIRDMEVVFGIGPAGTGKTFLAVAAALEALENKHVEKIILTRPAVEAGEALGFLPGDLTEKIQPYLRPLYDAMYEMVGAETVQRYVERRILEIAPLAYMRGRTLSNAYIILDEAQNTTPEQMMMFLTRLGENGRMTITGDITQIDLPRHKYSGLKEALHVLRNVPGIGFFEFEGSDVVRHKLVGRIIKAYEAYNEATGAHERRAEGTR